MHGDCIERMKEIPDHSVNMILCDLPYGATDNKWDSVIPLDQLWREYNRVLKKDGVIVLTAQHKFAAQLIASNISDYRYKIIWLKSRLTGFLNARYAPLRCHEEILIFYKKRPVFNPVHWFSTPYQIKNTKLSTNYKKKNKGQKVTVSVSSGERKPTDVIYCADQHETRFHPTQKPVALGRYLIRTYTNKGDVVLDNCFGSGAFLVAADIEDRRFIGIERNENVVDIKRNPVDCFAILERRLAEAREQKKNGTLPDIFDSLHPSASFLCSKKARRKANDNAGIALSA